MKKVFGAYDLPTPSENALGLSDPESYWDGISRFDAEYRVMKVKLLHVAETNLLWNYLVIFEPVMYFQGFTSWLGANFRVLTISEYLHLMAKDIADQYDREGDTWVISSRLFEVKAKEGIIRLTANTITLIHNPDGDYA